MESKEDLANTVNDENYQILLDVSNFHKNDQGIAYNSKYGFMTEPQDSSWKNTEEYFDQLNHHDNEEDEKKDEVGGLVEEISALSMEERPLILALDCEMSHYQVQDEKFPRSDLIRLSVVGFDLANLSNDLDVMSETICNSNVLLDVLVKPAHAVSDMRTKLHHIRLFILF